MISEHTRTKKDFSVAILDIDFFKKINDTFGHQAGDYILKEFTKTITHNLRPYDVLGRYGGEEFMIILDWVSKETALIIVERILTDVRQKKYVYGDATICFTFSAGISDCKDAEEDFTVEKLVEKAGHLGLYRRRSAERGISEMYRATGTAFKGSGRVASAGRAG